MQSRSLRQRTSKTHAIGRAPEDHFRLSPQVGPYPTASFSGDQKLDAWISFKQSRDQNPPIPLRLSQFLSIKLSAPGAKAAGLYALLDGGCSHSCISQRFFDAFRRYNRATPQAIRVEQIPPIQLGTAITDKSPSSIVTSKVSLIVHFQADNGKTVRIPVQFHIAPDLSENCYIGQDFIGSAKTIAVLRDSLVLSVPHTVRPWETVPRNQSWITIPFEDTTRYIAETTMLLSSAPLQIPPKSTVIHKCLVKDYHRLRKHFGKSILVLKIPSLDYRGLEIVEAHSTFFPGRVAVHLLNDTHKSVNISARSPIASMQIIEDTEDMLMAGLRLSQVMPALDASLTCQQLPPNGAIQGNLKTDPPFRTNILEGPERNRPYTDKDILNGIDLSAIPQIGRKRVKDIIRSNIDVFARHTLDVGYVGNLIKADIELLPHAKPKVAKPFPISPQIKEEVADILDYYTKCGIIGPCTSPTPIISNILFLRKPDKSLRLLLDARLINSMIKPVQTVMTSQSDIFAALAGCTHVSTLDVSQAFYSIPLTERARLLTAFYDHNRNLRQFNRLIMGLKNSPDYLRAAMQLVLGDLTGVSHFADDIIVHTKGDLDLHLDLFNEVLARLRRAGFKVKHKKTTLCQNQTTILGQVFDTQEQCLDIPASRIQKYNNTPYPKTPKQLKSFLMSVNFFRNHIPQFSELIKPIHVLTKLVPRKFKFTKEHQGIMDRIKAKIRQRSKLYLPRPDLPFEIWSGASEDCLSFDVYQKDDKDVLWPVSFLSRMLTKTELNQDPIHKVALAIQWGLKACSYLLDHAKKITLNTDVRALAYIRCAKQASSHLHRIANAISRYPLAVFHSPSSKGKDTKDNIDHQQCFQGSPIALSPKDSLELVRRLAIPATFQFSPNEIRRIMGNPYPKRSPARKRPQKSEVKVKPQNQGDQPRSHGKTPKARGRQSSQPDIPAHKLRNIQPATASTLPAPPRSTTNNGSSKNLAASDLDPGDPLEEPLGDYNGYTEPVDAVLDPAPLAPPSHPIEERPVQPDPTTQRQQHTPICSDGVLSVSEFRVAQETDPRLAPIIQDPRKQAKQGYFLRQGLLIKKTRKGPRVCLPDSLLKPLFDVSHNSDFGMHMSAAKICKRATMRYFHPQLTKQIQQLAKDCFFCTVSKANTLPQHTVSKNITATQPRLLWHCDLALGFPTSNQGHKLVMLFVDSCSLLCNAIPLKSKAAEDLSIGLEQGIFTPYGTPKLIRCDQESALLRSVDIREKLHAMGIQLVPTAHFSSQTNGRCETMIKMLKNAIRCHVAQCNDEGKWDTKLAEILLSFNSNPTFLGHSPYKLVFGTETSLPTDLLSFATTSWATPTGTQASACSLAEPRHIIDKEPITPNFAPTPQSMSEIYDDISDWRSDFQTQVKKRKNANRVSRSFTPGQFVFKVKNPVQGKSALVPPLSGPYVITELSKSGNSALLQHIAEPRRFKEHFGRIVATRSTFANTPVHPDWDRAIKIE